MCPTLSSAYLQLSRMVPTNGYIEVPITTKSLPPMEQGAKLTRLDYLKLAHQYDDGNPAIYEDIAVALISNEQIELNGNFMTKSQLREKAEKLRLHIQIAGDPVEVESDSDNASGSSFRLPKPTNDDYMTSSIKSTSTMRVSVGSQLKYVPQRTKYNCFWNRGLQLGEETLVGSELTRITLIRSSLNDVLKFSILNACKDSTEVKKQRYHLMKKAFDQIDDAKVEDNPYRAIILLEWDVQIVSKDESKMLSLEVDRCKTSKGGFIPYLQTAKLALEEYLADTITQQKANLQKNFADPMYFLACALYSRKTGNFRDADLMLTLFSESAPGLAQEIVQFEKSILSKAKEASLHKAALAKAKHASINSISVKYQSCKDEWEDEKRSLSDDEQQALVCMDKIMSMIGLDKVFSLFLLTSKGRTLMFYRAL
jgi:hypothetical protein